MVFPSTYFVQTLGRVEFSELTAKKTHTRRLKRKKVGNEARARSTRAYANKERKSALGSILAYCKSMLPSLVALA